MTRRLVVDLASPRAAWRIPPTAVEAIPRALGAGWEVVEVQAPAASDGDGGSGSPEAAAVSRGTLLHEPPLLELLDASRLRGAALDVFAVEPLPAGHPFWGHPRVLVSPHVAAVTARFWDRETGLIVDNIKRYLAGSPLENTVDQEAGY